MAKHLVKCTVCGKQFDTNEVQAVKIGTRRYAHSNCDPSNTNFVPMEQKDKETQDLENLKKYIGDLYGTNANWGLISKQIKDFKEKGYSYTGMYKTLQYVYEIKHLTVDKSQGGIGIIGFYYKQAHDYWYSLWLAKQNNNFVKPQDYIPEVVEVSILNPQRDIKKRQLFTFLDEENIDGE